MGTPIHPFNYKLFPPCKDCAERTAECKITCEKWSYYEKEHAKELEDKRKGYTRYNVRSVGGMQSR